jgi:hypothetical protein
MSLIGSIFCFRHVFGTSRAVLDFSTEGEFMGFQLAKAGEVEAHKAELREFGLGEKSYKLVEALFRQSLMRVEGEPFSYEQESMVDFKTSDSPEVQIQALRRHIRDWEQRLGAEYGFAHIVITEFNEDLATLFEFHDLLGKLENLMADSKFFFDGIDKMKWIAELKNKARGRLNQQEGRYISEGKDNRIELSIQHHDYLAYYISYASSIFRPFVRKNTVEKLIVCKIQWEHPDVDYIQEKFTQRFINDRLRKGDRYRLLAEEPFKRGIVTTQLLDRLKNLNTLE